MTDFELKRQIRSKELIDSFRTTDFAIALFQLKQKHAYKNIIFQPYTWFCEKMNSDPEPYMYDIVHVISLSQHMCADIMMSYKNRNMNEALADYMFDIMNQYKNLNPENGYYGVSASTSDVIVIKEGDRLSALYINPFGYVMLPHFTEKVLP